MASFSSQTKLEACRVAVRSDCCRRAELYAMMRFCGVIGINRQGVSLTLSTSIEPVAQRILSLVRRVFDAECDIRRVEREQLNRLERIEIALVGETARQALLACGMLQETDDGGSFFEDGIGYRPMNDCCMDAYLRGVFFACGTMLPPSKGYHLEFVLESAQLASDLCDLLYSMDINAHMTVRKEKNIVYVKESECVLQYLARIGAHNAYLQMEDERMIREIKNDVNRSVNCSTANINKTTNAALKQIRAIEFLEREGVLREQSLSIRQMAEMRLEYPEASLDELAQMMNITKSGVNHRLRKLVHLAALLQGSEE